MNDSNLNRIKNLIKNKFPNLLNSLIKDPKIKYIAIVGSYAYGNENLESDLDILVVINYQEAKTLGGGTFS
ncbi:MAG: nucleotidyltransferase domain-containing protein [Candidatus Heimdallarchaeota archaeon]|nr:nucleotidyltransferase domain-containing protein [Candidatus Heimdallarchaeota archaeon]